MGVNGVNIMDKTKYISNCKQEELTATLLAICGEIFLFGFFMPCETDEELSLFFKIVTMICILITLFLFFVSNRKMMMCYKLIKHNGVIKKAVVEASSVYLNKGILLISVWFQILENGGRYKWKEKYNVSLKSVELDNELKKYLERCPEIEVIVDERDYKKNYVLLEQDFLERKRQRQSVYKKINWFLVIVVILGVLFLWRNV